MPLPQKVIEQLSREPPRTPGWSSDLLIFSSTIFLISLFIYFGLVYGYRNYLNSEVKTLHDQIQTFGQQVSLEEQTKIINFYSQITNIKSLLLNHIFSSQLLSWLESNTQTNVYWSKFNLDTAGNKLSLIGQARSMNDVVQQLAIFESKSEPKKADVRNVTYLNGLWQFDVALIFDPSFLRGAVQNQ